MRTLPILLLATLAGCQAQLADVPHEIEAQVAAVAPVRITPDLVPCGATPAFTAPAGPMDLPALWGLTLSNNPTLREAAAEVEAARGQAIQAGKYPNPRFSYTHDTLGNNQSPLGTISFQLSQEVVTAGKRQLGVAVAARGADAALLGLLSRKFEVLTRLRRGWYDYQAWRQLVQVHAEVVHALAEGVEVTRKQVEEAKTRPRADLVRLQALLEEARIDLARSQASVEASWRQLAADVGVPGLPMPENVQRSTFSVQRSTFTLEAIAARVLAANTALKQAAAEAERARLEVQRARAEAVPNVTVGGGWDRESVDHVSGAVLSVETALPVWDRKQGRIHEAQAHWARAQAAQQSAATRLLRETAEAFGRYRAARQQVERLTAAVLPRLAESLDLVRKGYQAGAAGTTFADVFLAQQSLNEARIRLAEARRDLWLAIADLEGLMQLDLGEVVRW